RRSNLERAMGMSGGRLRFLESSVAGAVEALSPDARFDEIYHLAAAVGVRLVVEDPIGSIETNVGQTAAILRFAHERRAPGASPRLLIASSSEVYGKSGNTPFGEDDDVVYGPTTVSRWSYALSKAIDEHLALAYHAAGGLAVVVVRFFNTVGPRQVGDYGMVLPRFVLAALRGDDLEVHGDGEQVRCFCDVRDVVGVLPRLLAEKACVGRVFNLGSDRPISILGLADLVIRTLGSRSRVRRVPYTEAYGPGFEDLRRRVPDLSRIRAAVGFEAGLSIEDTIRSMAVSMQADGVPECGS
ncbi:MAG TPA: GDP-mannose 4,6-dehydratase, partial [Phycisphaerales bacterium]|nr:GDP-mannose 4,6-dehydratase [Phycisphaerales bacterium]